MIVLNFEDIILIAVIIRVVFTTSKVEIILVFVKQLFFIVKKLEREDITMKREDLTQKEIDVLLKSSKTGYCLAEKREDEIYQLFCQPITEEELEENYDIDENKQLVKKSNVVEEDLIIGELPDCVKRLALLALKGIELCGDELLDVILEINSLENYYYMPYLGGGCFNTDLYENEWYDFDNRVEGESYEVMMTVSESDCMNEMVEGYSIYNLLDAFYNLKNKEIGTFDGGCMNPMTWVEFSEESSGKTSMYKCLRRVVDEPKVVLEDELKNLRAIKCTYYGTPKEDGEYYLSQATEKVYTVKS